MSDADNHGSAPAERALARKSVSEKPINEISYQDTYPGHLRNRSSSSIGSREISVWNSGLTAIKTTKPHSPTFSISTSVKSLDYCQTYPIQGINAFPLPLGEPRSSDHGKFLSELRKKLWAISYDHHSFLYSASGNIGRAIDELARVHLPGTWYAKNRSGWAGWSSLPT